MVFYENLIKKTNQLYKELVNYIFIRICTPRGIIKHLEREIFETLSKLDVSREYYRSVETYVIKMSMKYNNEGVQGQSFLAPVDESGRINFLEFLNKLIPGDSIISLGDGHYDQTLLRDLGIQLYTLRQLYSLRAYQNVYYAVKTCTFLVEPDRLEILKVLSSSLHKTSFTNFRSCQ
jgi:hypothetical protein